MKKIIIDSETFGGFEITPPSSDNLPSDLMEIIYKHSDENIRHFVKDGHMLDGNYLIMDILGEYVGSTDIAAAIMGVFLEECNGLYEVVLKERYELHGNYKSKVIYTPVDKIDGKEYIYVATHAYDENDVVLGDL